MNELSIYHPKVTVAALEASLWERCGRAEADAAVADILGVFPGQTAKDPKAYVEGLRDTLAGLPGWVVERLGDRRRGIPARFTFLPALAEVAKLANEIMAPVVAELARSRIAEGQEAKRREVAEARAAITPEDREAAKREAAAFASEAKRDDPQPEPEETEERKRTRAILKRAQCQTPGWAVKRHMAENPEQYPWASQRKDEAA